MIVAILVVVVIDAAASEVAVMLVTSKVVALLGVGVVAVAVEARHDRSHGRACDYASRRAGGSPILVAHARRPPPPDRRPSRSTRVFLLRSPLARARMQAARLNGRSPDQAAGRSTRRVRVMGPSLPHRFERLGSERLRDTNMAKAVAQTYTHPRSPTRGHVTTPTEAATCCVGGALVVADFGEVKH